MLKPSFTCHTLALRFNPGEAKMWKACARSDFERLPCTSITCRGQPNISPSCQTISKKANDLQCDAATPSQWPWLWGSCNIMIVTFMWFSKGFASGCLPAQGQETLKNRGGALPVVNTCQAFYNVSILKASSSKQSPFGWAILSVETLINFDNIAESILSRSTTIANRPSKHETSSA